MRKPFSERRFSDEELSRILDEAATTEGSAAGDADDADGHTLAEIREIAREAGIDPDAVDRAAARLVASPDVKRRVPAPPGKLSGVVHVERLIPRPLSDAEMRALAQQIEVVVNRSGRLRQWGDWVEWRDHRDRLYVGIVRGNGETRIRAIADHSRDSVGGLVAIGFVGFLVMAATPGPLIGLPLLVITLVAAWRYWGWRGGATRRELTDLLDILEDSVRTR